MNCRICVPSHGFSCLGQVGLPNCCAHPWCCWPQDGWVLLQAASEVQDPGASGKRGPEGSAGVAACSNSSKRNRQQ